MDHQRIYHKSSVVFEELSLELQEQTKISWMKIYDGLQEMFIKFNALDP